MRLEMFLLFKFVTVVGFVVAVVVVDVVITDFVAAVVVWEVFGVVDVVAVVVASDVAVIDTLVLCSHFWCCRRCNISLKLLLLRSSLLSFLLLKLLPTFFLNNKTNNEAKSDTLFYFCKTICTMICKFYCPMEFTKFSNNFLLSPPPQTLFSAIVAKNASKTSFLWRLEKILTGKMTLIAFKLSSFYFFNAYLLIRL